MTKSEYHKEEIIQKYDNKNKFHNTKINSANKKYATAMQILYCPFLFLQHDALYTKHLLWCYLISFLNIMFKTQNLFDMGIAKSFFIC